MIMMIMDIRCNKAKQTMPEISDGKEEDKKNRNNIFFDSVYCVYFVAYCCADLV